MGNFIAKANNLTELVINDGSFIKLSNKCKAHMILYNYDVNPSFDNITTKFTGSIYSDTKLSKIWMKCSNKFVLAHLNPDIKVISKKLDIIHKNITEFNFLTLYLYIHITFYMYTCHAEFCQEFVLITIQY